MTTAAPGTKSLSQNPVGGYNMSSHLSTELEQSHGRFS